MGVTLLVLALLAQAPPEERPEIASVEIRLPQGASLRLLDGVRPLIAVRRGQPLSRRAVQRSIEALYATQRFADVVVRLAPAGQGVRLTFDVTPRQLVSAVYVEGAHAFPRAELLAATQVAAGAEYYAERAEQAAEALSEFYWRHGYRSARVSPAVDVVEEGVDLGFVVEEGEPERISALSFAGDPGLSLAVLRGALGESAGAVLDLDALEKGVEALRALLRRERFYRARVEAPVVLGRGRVVIPLVAGPRYELVFAGNRRMPDAALRAVLGYDGQETLDQGLEARLEQRLVRFYRFRGFHDVRVAAREVLRPGTRAAALGFEIDEGEPLRVERIEWEGNQAISDAELREVLVGTMEAALPPAAIEAHSLGDPLALEGRMAPVFGRSLPSPPLDTVLEEAAWDEAAKAMAALYRERGYMTASVRLERVDVEGGRARARFAVHEGPRAKVRSVRVAGLPKGFRSPTLEKPRESQVFSSRVLEELRAGTSRELARKGYLFASVKVSHALDDSGTFADCEVAVDPGPQVRVRKVLPVGQARTAEQIVLSQAAMSEGEPLDADALYVTQSNLMALGIFRTAEVEMLSPETPDSLKTVLLKVKERPRVSGEFGLGYFLAEGPRIVADVTAPNLGGLAINFSGHAQISWFALSQPARSKPTDPGYVDVTDLAAWEQIGWRGSASIQNRGLLPANVGARFDVVTERVFRPSFRFSRVAGVPSFDWSTGFEVPGVDWARAKLTMQLQYELEWAGVSRSGTAFTSELPLTFADQERLRFLFGSFALQTVKFTPTFDLRDNALVPRKGVLVQGSVEYTGAVATRDEAGNPVPVSFLKLSGLATGYVPITSRITLAVSARAGRIFPLSPGSVTPPVKRFFLGGATNMRGFNEDQLVADDLRAQYRREARDCQILATREGCTSAAAAILGGKQVPSQGGELFALLKSELTFPAFSVFDLAVFFETGNLWLAPPKTGFPLRVVAGAGLRYTTPIGRLALDVGINLSPDPFINEPAYVIHFNIGSF